MLSESLGCFSAEDLILTDADVLTEALAAALLLFTAPRLTANHRGPVRISQSERAPVEPANQRAGQPRLLAQSNTAARGGGNVNMSDLICTSLFQLKHHTFI